ncbi:MAG: hypothetical protein R2699_15445 [Acidimicrobiales bacterium]
MPIRPERSGRRRRDAVVDEQDRAGGVEEVDAVVDAVDRQRLAQLGRSRAQLAGRAGTVRAAAMRSRPPIGSAARTSTAPGSPSGPTTTLAQWCMP